MQALNLTAPQCYQNIRDLLIDLALVPFSVNMLGRECGIPRELGAVYGALRHRRSVCSLLTAVRWPDGTICAACGGRKGWPNQRGTYLLRGLPTPDVVDGRHILFIKATCLCGAGFPGDVADVHTEDRSECQGIAAGLGLGSTDCLAHAAEIGRNAMVRLGASSFTGTVEVDETYIGGQESVSAVASWSANRW